VSEWQEVKLGELVDIGSSKRIFYEDYVNVGIPFYRSKEVIEKHNGNDISTDLFITKEKFEQIKEKYGAPQTGDLLLTSVGTLGIPYIVQEGEEFYFKDGNLTWFKNYKSNLYNEFLYYWIISPIGKNALDMMSIGSTQAALTIQGLKNLDFDVPPIEEQKAIASVLSSLDDKIDLLHRQNTTLERMAETLFRQWFVEEAQEDWEFVELGTYVDCFNGVSYKSSELNPSKVAMVTLKSFDRNGGFRLDGFKEFTGRFKEQHVVIQGDLVVAHTDITQGAEVIGNPVLVVNDTRYENMVISMDLVKVKSKYDWLSNEFLYRMMRTREFKEHCLGYSNGSTVLHLSKQAIPSFEFFMPPKEKIQSYTESAKDLFAKKFKNIEQILTLEKLRDNLLPKLMSGEVRL
jgi:type I restriction enzyme S subunit